MLGPGLFLWAEPEASPKKPIRVVLDLLARDDPPRWRTERPTLVPAERGTEEQLFALVRHGPFIAECAPVEDPGGLRRVDLEPTAYEFDEVPGVGDRRDAIVLDRKSVV